MNVIISLNFLQVLPQDVVHTVVSAILHPICPSSGSQQDPCPHPGEPPILAVFQGFYWRLGWQSYYIQAAPGALKHGTYRNRKGFTSQNCLFSCDFDLFFTYALTGWEGSATDARIYQDARTKGLHIPPGKYFLADAGFPLRAELLVPYRNIRYHLAEWRRAQLR